jgi:DNA-binding CsgD family transcriptional regulator
VRPARRRHPRHLQDISARLGRLEGAASDRLVPADAVVAIGLDLPPRLTARERAILTYLAQGLTCEEVATNLGVSRERLRQLEANAVRKLEALVKDRAESINEAVASAPITFKAEADTQSSRPDGLDRRPAKSTVLTTCAWRPDSNAAPR